MKATGIVRRIDDCVIIRPKTIRTQNNQSFECFVQFHNFFTAFVFRAWGSVERGTIFDIFCTADVVMCLEE